MPISHIHEVNILSAGWYCLMQDNTVFTEDMIDWINVPNKNQIQLMGMKRMHKFFEITGKAPYINPGVTKYLDLKVAANSNVPQVTANTTHSYFIGYYDTDCKVIHRVRVSDGYFSIEKEPYK